MTAPLPVSPATIVEATKASSPVAAVVSAMRRIDPAGDPVAADQVRAWADTLLKALYTAQPVRWEYRNKDDHRPGCWMQADAGHVYAAHQRGLVVRALFETPRVIQPESGEGRTKSGKWREVPLNRYARWALRHLPDPIVTVHKDTVSDWFKKDSDLAGVGGHLHRLRHTFCAHMVMAGVPLRRVQALAGHADYATTEKYYAHLSPEGDETAVSKLQF
ncbi:TPA: tyrosine-type recombinase/integrase [Stenotrophomonas maltophilia]